MANDSPASILYSASGAEVAVGAGDAVSGRPGVLAAGSDGSVARFLATDPSGRQIVVGPGGPVGVSGAVQVVGPVGLTGPLQQIMAPVGITGPVVATGYVGITGSVRVNNPVGVTGPVGLTGPLQRVNEPVGITGPVVATGYVGVTGSVRVNNPVGITGPVGLTGPLQRVNEPVGITGPVGVTGSVRVNNPVGVTGPVGLTGPLQRVNEPVGITGPVGVTGVVQALQPTASALKAQVQVFDASNGPAAVKAASTVPTASDPALVVILSPNQQAIPVSASPATATSGLNFGTIALAGGTSGGIFAVRSTTYNEQTTNAQRSIASSSANDTSAGTGARQVQITYYDSSGNGPYVETVTLNGTTAVNTVATNICFIEEMVVTLVGTGNTNAGVITLYTTTGGGGTVIGTIGIGTIVSAIGDGRTLWAHHYVPVGKTCNITGLSVGASAPATFHLKAKATGVANAAEEVITGLTTTTAAFQRNYGSPVVVQGPARITGYGVPSTNGVTLNVSFDFFETTT